MVHGLIVDCSHLMCTAYFIESVENPAGFLAVKCDSYESFLGGECDGNEKVSLGGDLLGVEGDFYFETNAEKPYSKENATYFALQ